MLSVPFYIKIYVWTYSFEVLGFFSLSCPSHYGRKKVRKKISYPPWSLTWFITITFLSSQPLLVCKLPRASQKCAWRNLEISGAGPEVGWSVSRALIFCTHYRLGENVRIPYLWSPRLQSQLSNCLGLWVNILTPLILSQFLISKMSWSDQAISKPHCNSNTEIRRLGTEDTD